MDNNTQKETVVECTRCRNKHKISERIEKKSKTSAWTDQVCPRCNCKAYYSPKIDNKC